MTSSDRHIAAARKTDPDASKGRDTWPSPPPSPSPPFPSTTVSRSPDDTDRQDTIPTPAPEGVTADAVVIPPLRGVTVEKRR